MNRHNFKLYFGISDKKNHIQPTLVFLSKKEISISAFEKGLLLGKCL